MKHNLRYLKYNRPIKNVHSLFKKNCFFIEFQIISSIKSYKKIIFSLLLEHNQAL